MSILEAGRTAAVSLRGCEYRIQWVAPDSPHFSVWDKAGFRLYGPYKEHVHPIHNLQEDLPSDPPESDDWSGLWEHLAGNLASRVDRYALVACDGDRLV